MLCAYANKVDPNDPLSCLSVGERDEPTVDDDDWTTVTVASAALNHHDLWSLAGVGLTEEQCPMTLGCDAAGTDAEGNEVIVHSVIADAEAGGGDETLDPKRSLLSEKFDGTLAEKVVVPRSNLVAKPAQWSMDEAACIPTAYLTAYRMLTTKGRVRSGDAVLVQGAGGGVASASVVLASAMGARVYATSRSQERREQVEKLGATAVEPGQRLPERVDVVIESVGEATFAHSMKSAKPGGRIVVCGSTSGHLPNVDLRRVFFLQLEILGSTMGTRDELSELVDFCVTKDLKPIIDSTYALGDAAEAFARLQAGEAFGKIVVRP